MKQEVITTWDSDLKFTTKIDSHQFSLDAMPESGGTDQGPSPKKLLLSALAGCTGIDVISILRKMRSEPTDFRIIVEANMTEEHPKHYDQFHIIYEFTGKQLDMEKLKKAVELSQERYCGVSFMFRQFAKISNEIKIIQE